MNHAIAYAESTMRGYVGRFRLSWRTETFPVRESRNGPIRYFPTAVEAECEAWRVKAKIEEPRMRRAGDRVGTSKSAAEALFCFPGKGKAVAVERRRA